MVHIWIILLQRRVYEAGFLLDLQGFIYNGGSDVFQAWIPLMPHVPTDAAEANPMSGLKRIERTKESG